MIVKIVNLSRKPKLLKSLGRLNDPVRYGLVTIFLFLIAGFGPCSTDPGTIEHQPGWHLKPTRVRLNRTGRHLAQTGRDLLRGVHTRGGAPLHSARTSLRSVPPHPSCRPPSANSPGPRQSRPVRFSVTRVGSKSPGSVFNDPRVGLHGPNRATKKNVTGPSPGRAKFFRDFRAGPGQLQNIWNRARPDQLQSSGPDRTSFKISVASNLCGNILSSLPQMPKNFYGCYKLSAAGVEKFLRGTISSPPQAPKIFEW